jgi:hypothetical protein
MPICRQTHQTKVPERSHSEPCEGCGDDHPIEKCPWVDYSERPCGQCGQQELKFSKEAGECICPNCGWPLGR